MAGTSYDPEATVEGLEGEIRRLEAQVSLSFDAEFDTLRAAGLRDGTRVVDVGCGTGAFLAQLAEALPTCTFTGIDPDPRLLSVAAEATRRFGDRISVVQAAVDDLPSELIGNFDSAVCRYLMQHLSDPVGALRSMVELLAPGGLIALIDVDGSLWGTVHPAFPELSALHAKAWCAQSRRGGDRFIGRKLWGYLRDAGCTDPQTRCAVTHSDERGIEAFLPVIDPRELQPLVVEGVLSLKEYGAMVAGFEAFRRDPDPYIMSMVFVVTGRRSR